MTEAANLLGSLDNLGGSKASGLKLELDSPYGKSAFVTGDDLETPNSSMAVRARARKSANPQRGAGLGSVTLPSPPLLQVGLPEGGGEGAAGDGEEGDEQGPQGEGTALRTLQMALGQLPTLQYPGSGNEQGQDFYGGVGGGDQEDEDYEDEGGRGRRVGARRRGGRRGGAAAGGARRANSAAYEGAAGLGALQGDGDYIPYDHNGNGMAAMFGAGAGIPRKQRPPERRKRREKVVSLQGGNNIRSLFSKSGHALSGQLPGAAAAAMGINMEPQVGQGGGAGLCWICGGNRNFSGQG
jgi:hypothetical protein